MLFKPSFRCGHPAYITITLLVLLSGNFITRAAQPQLVELNRLFSDNMVLQRDVPCPIWGKTTPKTQVKVTLSKASITVTSDEKGLFTAVLPAQPAGGPYPLKVSVPKYTKEIKNVLLGDVWLCGGQSNMQMSVKNSMNSDKEIASANYPQIRMFNVNNYPDVLSRGKDVSPEGRWTVCSPKTIPYFSAVAYFFGRTLNQKLKVPIGLVETSWSGTPAQSWISYESLKESPELEHYANELDNLILRESKLKAKGLWEKTVAREGMNEANKAWAGTNYDDTEWGTIPLPQTWEGFPPIGVYDGAVWFRRTIEIPKSAAGKDATLSLGAIDDFDITWFNGEKIGSTGQETKDFWQHPRSYKVAGKQVKAGKNVVTIRVFDHYGGGGFQGSPEQMFLETAGSKISLHGDWKYKKGFEIPPEALNNRMDPLKGPNTTTALYNTRIRSLANFPFKGVIWYQGEANANNAGEYLILFQKLIADWRKLLGAKLPFIYVQLANFKAQNNGNWAKLRESQRKALSIPDTAMAVTIDIGAPDDIHPKNKQEVGRRLALGALHTAYGQKIPFSGPLVDKIHANGENSLRLSFNCVFGGLKAKDEKLTGFSISDAEGKNFYPAQAIIKGNDVIISSEKVKEPAWVRYAWKDNPQKPSLYNGAGLPASPFSIKIGD